MQNPGKPVAAIRIGVTGHRKFSDAAIETAIEQQVSKLFKTMTEALKRASEDSVFSPSKETFCQCVSSLAVGADRIVARVALDRGWRLNAVLPFATDDYEKDFSESAELKDFRSLSSLAGSQLILPTPPQEADRNKSYALAGRMVLRNSDILIAIWDGQAARGHGGTAEIVEEARKTGLPVIWVNAEKPEELKITTADDSGWQTASEKEIVALVQHTLLPPAVFSDDSVSRDRLAQFAKETRGRGGHWAVAYSWLASVFGRQSGEKPPSAQRIKALEPDACWEGFFENALSSEDARKAREAFAQPYAWADHLSVFYASLYRSAFVLIFLLAAASIIAGLTGLLTSVSWLGSASWHKFWHVLAELVLIAGIIILITVGKWRDWHRKWLDYRMLAELLRIGRLGVIVGHGSEPPDSEDAEIDEQAAWVAWRVRAAFRQAPLADNAFADVSITELTDSIIEDEIDPQIAYHIGTDEKSGQAGRLHLMAHRLESVSNQLFYFTGYFGLLYLSALLAIELGLVDYLAAGSSQDDGYQSSAGSAGYLYFAESLIRYGGAIIMASAPALAAALSGIVGYGDFDGAAQRSKLIGKRLVRLKERAKSQQDHMGYRRLLDFISDLAQIQIGDLAAWRALYQSRILRPA